MTFLHECHLLFLDSVLDWIFQYAILLLRLNFIVTFSQFIHSNLPFKVTLAMIMRETKRGKRARR